MIKKRDNKVIFCCLVIPMLIAISLFFYGINFPLHDRLNGNARTYFAIAKQFTSLHDALFHIGYRRLNNLLHVLRWSR